MNNSNNIFFSEEAAKLFSLKPPLLIRYGYILICFFIITLIMISSLIHVPYHSSIKIQKANDGSFLFENNTNLSINKSFEIIFHEGTRILINTYNFIYLDDNLYIQFTLNEDQRVLMKNNLDEYEIAYRISLMHSYFYYLLYGI